MTSSLRIIRSLVALSLLCAPSHSAAQGAPAAVRPARPWIAEVLTVAIGRAPTLARLVQQVRSSRLIVQIDEDTNAERRWDGRIRFLAHAGGYRYVRIDLRRQSPHANAAVLAHELQHAIEIEAADVGSRDAFAALFRRIGFAMADAPDQFDTEAAIDAGVATLQELTGRLVSLPARTAEALDCFRAARAARAQ